jgi:hypothetical protein
MSGQARHITKGKEATQSSSTKRKGSKDVMHQGRGKRRPRSDYEHAFACSFLFLLLRSQTYVLNTLDVILSY